MLTAVADLGRPDLPLEDPELLPCLVVAVVEVELEPAAPVVADLPQGCSLKNIEIISSSSVTAQLIRK